MDLVRQTTQEECEDIFKFLPKTVKALRPTVEARNEQILAVERKTFQYGETDRHQLDIYYPAPEVLDGSGPAPVLVWCYGGGFTTGDRTIRGSGGLVYGTVGAFFARHGFVTVIPDYRLAPAVTYPAQSADIRDAMLWLTQNVATPADLGRIVLMGHSAGAVNVAALLLDPALLAGTDLRARIRGLVLHGAAYHFAGPLPIVPESILEAYLGAVDVREQHTPLGLLRALPDEALKQLPEILVVEAEKEPSGLRHSCVDFAREYEERIQAMGGGKEIKRVVCEGHDHVSPNWVLGSGDGDEWGVEVAQWAKGVLHST